MLLTVNNRINRLHKWSLRIANDDYTSSFEQLIEKDNTTNNHQQNLNTLATEMYVILFTEKRSN